MHYVFLSTRASSIYGNARYRVEPTTYHQLWWYLSGTTLFWSWNVIVCSVKAASLAALIQATKVFTLAFFALALVICLILTAYITVMLLRRRRLRLAIAHTGVRPQVKALSHDCSVQMPVTASDAARSDVHLSRSIMHTARQNP